MKLLKHKLTGDIAWSMGSLAILAVSGVVINLVIAGLRDAAALGAFNQGYAVYIVASQIAVCGLHYSVMRHAALYTEDVGVRSRLLLNAAVFAFTLGACAAFVVHSSAPLLGRAFDSDAAAAVIRNSGLGLLLFPLNKVLIAYLNGLRRMKAFAVLQAGRYIVVMAWVAAISASTLSFDLVAYGFFAAEAMTCCGALGYIASRRLAQGLDFDGSWTKRHFAFGSKSLLAGMFVELNSRVDVLMIGFFLSDRSVGVYSFAAMLVDGLYHVLAVVRTNFNPVLVANIRDGDWAGSRRLLSQSKRYFYPAAAALAVCLVVAFWLLAEFVVPAKGLQEGLPALIILMAGLTLVSAFVPFDNLLLVSGHPGFQTLQHLTVVVVNIGFNAVLIPVFGIVGAGLATALSYVLGIAALMMLVHQLLRWNLLTNNVRIVQAPA